MWPFKIKVTEPRTCESCYFYDEYRTDDRMNPDKTLTPGELKFRVCGYNECEPFKLNDVTPCDEWKPDARDYRREKKTAALSYLIRNLPLPPKPPQ